MIQGADLLPAGRVIDPSNVPAADACFISSDYFRALGIPLLTGRSFSDHDGPATPSVTVISESVARRWWPGDDPIGKRIAINYRSLGRPNESSPTVRQVVGIVADVRQHGLEAPSGMSVYRHINRTRRDARCAR